MAVLAPTSFEAIGQSENSIMLTWMNQDDYTEVVLQYDEGSGWTSLAYLAGNTESYLHESVTQNTIIYYRVRGEVEGGLSDWVYAQSACWTTSITTEGIVISDSVTIHEMVVFEGIVISDIVTDDADYTEPITEGIVISDYILDAESLVSDYGYYLGDSAGKVYEYSDSHKSDDGTSISGHWQGKQTDFADQQSDCINKYKTVYTARLHYVDLDADTTVSVSLSTDGGATWTTKTKILGTGDGKIKSQDFSFTLYGQYFTPKVENASTNKLFKFVALEIYYEILGQYFQEAT